MERLDEETAWRDRMEPLTLHSKTVDRIERPHGETTDRIERPHERP
jgi:hypothetical protein